MKSITFGKDSPSDLLTLNWFAIRRRILLAGVAYSWYNVNAEQQLDGTRDVGDTLVEELDYHQWQYPEDPGRNMLVVCPGGIGDVLVVSVAIRQIQKYFPNTQITACCAAQGNETLPLTTDNVRCIDYPIKTSIFHSFDATLVYEDITRDQRFRELNMSDFMLAFAGFDHTKILDVDKVPVIKEDPLARQFVESYLPKKESKWVAIQLKASSQPRTYPGSGLAFWVAPALAKLEGVTVFFVGSMYDFGGYTKRFCSACDGKIRVDENNTLSTCDNCGIVDMDKTFQKKVDSESEFGIVNLCGKMETIGELASFYSMSDLVIGPDSACLHFAGALSRPAIGLYSGIFPHELRSKYYSDQVPMQRHVECENCHGTGVLMPCEGNNYCLALTAIKPQEIINEATRLLA